MTDTAQNIGKRSTRWLKDAGFYVLHVLIGTVAVFLVAVTALEIIEQFINPKLVDRLLVGSGFPAQVVTGFVMGFVLNRYLQCKSAKWTWVVPAAGLLLYFPGYVTSQQGWGGAVSYIFGTNCGDCVEQIMTAGVLYGSITYSLGAWAAVKKSFNVEITGRDGTKSPSIRLFLTLLYSIAVVLAVFVLAFLFVLGTLLVSHWAGVRVKAAFGGPHYWGEIAVGLIGGVLVGARVKPALAKWVWVLPSIWVLVYMAYSVHSGDVWSKFFTSGCASPNIACPQQSFGTFPLFSSVAYSFGAWLTSRMRNQDIGSRR